MPYALVLTSDHKVGFAFQNIDHAVHYCVSNGTAGTAYTEIGVTRERKQAPPPNSEGHPENIDAWDEISFYIIGGGIVQPNMKIAINAQIMIVCFNQ